MEGEVGQVPKKRNTRNSEYNHVAAEEQSRTKRRQKKQQRKITNEDSVEGLGWERNASRRRKR